MSSDAVKSIDDDRVTWKKQIYGRHNVGGTVLKLVSALRFIFLMESETVTYLVFWWHLFLAGRDSSLYDSSARSAASFCVS